MNIRFRLIKDIVAISTSTPITSASILLGTMLLLPASRRGILAL